MNDTTTTSPAFVWAGRILIALTILFLVLDAGVNLFASHLVAADMEKTGFRPGMSAILGISSGLAAILYAIPRTRVLGAIVATGFIGGIVAVLVRIGEGASPPAIVVILVGAAAWGGLWFGDARVRALLPLRK